MSSELKTRPTGASVDEFLNAVAPAQRRDDGIAARNLLEEITGRPAEMWGPSIVGFDRYAYVGANKKPAEWPMIGFSPRKAELVFYVMPGAKARPDLLERLGRHRTGGSCLYIKTLADVDTAVLREILEHGYRTMQAKYPASSGQVAS